MTNTFTGTLGELSPTFGHTPVLVAYADMGGQLAGSDRFARFIVPGDIAGGRYLSQMIFRRRKAGRYASDADTTRLCPGMAAMAARVGADFPITQRARL